MIYLLTAIGLTPGGSCTVHIYTQQYTERHKTNNTQNNTKLMIVNVAPKHAGEIQKMHVMNKHCVFSWYQIRMLNCNRKSRRQATLQ